MSKTLSRRGKRWTSLAGASLIALSFLAWPNEADAAPRDKMRESYAQALDQANNLDYPGAAATIDAGINAAEQAGAGNDPVLASLYVLKAALLYSNEGEGAHARIIEALKKAAALNYYVVIPVEVRSPEMQGFLEEARAAAGLAKPDAITHSFPEPACGGDLVFEALLGVPDGGQAALYWRPVGSSDYNAVQMETFSNVASAVVRANEHQDADLEYIIAAFDANGSNAANLGTQDAPLSLPQRCDEAAPAGGGFASGDGEGEGGEVEGGVEGDGKDGDGGKQPKGSAGELPRVWINLGVGTGVGLAGGAVEQSYAQFRPANPGFLYQAEHAACAIARFASDGGELLDPQVLYGDPSGVTPTDPANPHPNSAFAVFARDQDLAATLAQAYQTAYIDSGNNRCADRHPVTTGLASAPFHIAPEIAFRLGERVMVGAYARLQVVDGSDVRGPASNLNGLGDPARPELGGKWHESVYPVDPARPPTGEALELPLTWAVGAKLKYLMGESTNKVRPLIGAFAGFGSSRLRVNLGFGQDENGNSVPDDEEVGADASNPAMPIDCFPVWPYLNSCNEPAGTGDNARAAVVTQNASGVRYDTVKLGQGFVGGLFGFNAQLHKHFAIFGEAQVGAWFPGNQTSVLFDLSVGPSISF